MITERPKRYFISRRMSSAKWIYSHLRRETSQASKLVRSQKKWRGNKSKMPTWVTITLCLLIIFLEYDAGRGIFARQESKV